MQEAEVLRGLLLNQDWIFNSKIRADPLATRQSSKVTSAFTGIGLAAELWGENTFVFLCLSKQAPWLSIKETFFFF